MFSAKQAIWGRPLPTTQFARSAYSLIFLWKSLNSFSFTNIKNFLTNSTIPKTDSTKSGKLAKIYLEIQKCNSNSVSCDSWSCLVPKLNKDKTEIYQHTTLSMAYIDVSQSIRIMDEIEPQIWWKYNKKFHQKSTWAPKVAVKFISLIIFSY